MKYRVLGKTGLRVSEIGFGCGNIGGLMIRAPFEERLSAVTRAIELGINYFDSAAAYGNGQSETNLGEVLSSIKASVTVGTKFNINREDISDIKGAVRRSLEASLKRLRRDWVDILQLHTLVVTDNSDKSRGINVKHVLGTGGVADALDGLRSQGLVRFLGFTGLGETEALHQIIASKRFDTVQAYCNLLNPSASVTVSDSFSGQNFRELIGKAAESGMGVLAIRVLAGGALEGDISRTGYASRSVGIALVPGNEYDLDRNRAIKLDFLLRGNVHNLSQAGVRFVLGQPNVSIVLVGFSNLAQIEEAVACSDRGPLPQSDMEQLKQLWTGDFR